MSEAKKPTHLLKVKERDSERKCTIGVGWLNQDGSMSISLNPCVALTSHDDVLITLFPINDNEPPEVKGPKKAVKVIVPRGDSAGHLFKEVDSNDTQSIQWCVKCKLRVTVDVPYNGVGQIQPCPPKKLEP